MPRCRDQHDACGVEKINLSPRAKVWTTRSYKPSIRCAAPLIQRDSPPRHDIVGSLGTFYHLERLVHLTGSGCLLRSYL